MIKPNWKVNLYAQGLTNRDIINTTLYNRGVEDIEDFLNPPPSYILPSSLFKNIEKASKLFINGINNKRTFIIHADVDTDGCTSGALIFRYLSAFDIEPITYINEGKKHGIQEDFHLPVNDGILIIVDSINNDPQDYLKLLDQGIDIIVLDHHIPKPEILAIQEKINLVSSANDYPNPYLSGSGVCWKFLTYVDNLLNTNIAYNMVDLAAIGIIADVCRVDSQSMENRAICNMAFNNVHTPAIPLLCDELNSNSISFSIANYVNAANRINDNRTALNLFISDNKGQLHQIIRKLDEDHEYQKQMVDRLYENLKEEADLQKDYKVMFFFGDHYDNFSGLLATKVVADYGKPCFVLRTNDDDMYRGSMRCNLDIDFRAIINEFDGAECNGHERSAGVIIDKTKIDEFVNFIDNKLEGIIFDDRTEIDFSINQSQVTPFLLHNINNINRITGSEFRPIKVLIEDVDNLNVSYMKNGKHLAMTSPLMKFIYWNYNDTVVLKDNDKLSAIGTLSENTFRGTTTLQMIMKDFLIYEPKVYDLPF